MKRVFQEPLAHFVVLGAALFALYALFNPAEEASSDEVVVSAGQIESLAASFARVWRRPPTTEELAGLVDDYVKEEVLSREAIKLGLDRHDPVIRRRLEQKMEFFVEDFEAIANPSEEELAAYLARNPEKFQQDARFTFRQVYLNPDQRGAEIDADAGELLKQLRTAGAQAEIDALGDRLLLPQAFVQEPEAAVAAQFGREFLKELNEVAVGEWSGPILSSYGQHLVYVSERTEAHMPALGEVRGRVERNYSVARREEVREEFLNELLERYTVTIQWPEREAESGTEQPTAMMDR